MFILFKLPTKCPNLFVYILLNQLVYYHCYDKYPHKIGGIWGDVLQSHTELQLSSNIWHTFQIIGFITNN